ncbi:MAG TPA: PKD domain-containing protein [Kribbellaceae bacterium]|nr:PKD domain-containing protein [Kribbellaceae bacterium]
MATVIISPSAAFAAPPSNDDFANATVILSLPFSDTVDTTEATTEPGEPFVFCGMQQTVWYSVTPTAKAAIQVQVTGSDLTDPLVAIWRADGPGLAGLSPLGECKGSGVPFDFLAEAGTTYYIQIGNGFFSSGGILSVDVQEIPPPANDTFASATPISALPFSDTVVGTIAAGVEPGEPMPSCGSQPPTGTLWYSVTPAVSGAFAARLAGFFQATTAAYTGATLTGLSEIGCNPFAFNSLVIHLNAGTTYHIQISGVFDRNPPVTLTLDVAVAPVANFAHFPSDASIFDSVQFFDASFDPEQVGFASWAWDFGDGTTATDCCPAHRYTADGDYTVRLTVTTFDGRTASTSQLVQVRTHDVAITKFSVPKAASAGQTRQITVGVNSNRYPETVQVALVKSVAGGFQQIGVLTLSVPVSGANRTTTFTFTYTFTSDDATIGKVTFKASASPVNARDALPADNEAIAPPTKVSN